MSSKIPKFLIGATLLCACDERTDLGELAESPLMSALSCADEDTIAYASSLAMSATHYQALETAYLDELGVELAPPAPWPDGTLVVVLSSDAELSCDSYPTATPETNRTVSLWLPPDRQQLGIHALSESSIAGPNPDGTPGAGKLAGGLDGMLQISAIQDDAIIGVACFDEIDDFTDPLGFDPSAAFSVTVCPN